LDDVAATVTWGYNEAVEFALRSAVTGDFEALWALDQQCFAPGIAYSQRELAAYMKQRGGFTLVAAHGDGIVGFLVGCARRNGLGHIITIDVASETRRMGVGAKLLAAAEERLRDAHCRAVYLETAVDNATALAFYKRHGYYLIKTVPRYYSNGVDALVLEKDLLSAAQAS
jgi:ribosomal-protein-alanine N-acetyltransferase